MNPKRIMKFLLAILVVNAVAAFPFGFVAGFLYLGLAPKWLSYLEGIAILISSVWVYAVLAKRQVERTWAHAWIVAVIYGVVSFFANLTVFHETVLDQYRLLIPSVLAVAIGVPIGGRRRRVPPESP